MSRSIEPHEPGEQPDGAMLRPGRSGWADDAVRADLGRLLDDVGEQAGFEVVSLSVLDDQETWQVVAAAAPQDVRDALLGTRVHREVVDTLLPLATTSGEVHLVLEEHHALTRGLAWWPDVEPDDTASWHRLDWLGRPVHDADGRLVAVLQLDLPRDRRRPDAGRLEVVDGVCQAVAPAVVAAIDHDRLATRLRMATTSRDVLRSCAVRRGVPAILEGSRDAILAGFRAREVVVTLLDERGRARATTMWPRRLERGRLPWSIVEVVDRQALTAWSQQQVLVVDDAHAAAAGLSAGEHDDLLGAVQALGAASLMLVPVGAGTACLGALLLTRAPGDPGWSAEEVDTALAVGHDLGRAVAATRSFHRDQDLMTELRELDAYKTGLIATVSHEMRNPLTAVAGHLELLSASAQALPPGSEASLAAMGRSTKRLERIIEDLLLFSKAGDSSQELDAERVDLRRVVADVRDLHDLAATQRDQHVTVSLPEEPVWVRGVVADLDCVVSNLVGNALKYSGAGTTVQLTLAQDAREVTLACADQGLGIAEEDLPLIFSEFYRSADPDVRRAGGTGLGLAIVSRIVTRHRGRVTVSSRVGQGSEFVLRLPSVAEFERRAAEDALEDQEARRLAGESSA